MIKINLLSQKRGKRAGAAIVTREPGMKDVVIGVAALAAAGAAMFVLVDAPRRSRLSGLRESNEKLQQEINAKNKQLVGFAELKKAADEADERAKAINSLNQSKVVPANVLHELSQILSNVGPTMTEEMAKKTGTGAESDPNKHFDLTWDPTHVNITQFSDTGKDSVFRIEGAAQAQIDIIQLSKRLQASAYFDAVSQQSEERATDNDSGITFYKFVITGKVAF